MKKIYNSPEVKVYKVNTHSVIAASITTNDALGNGTQLGKEDFIDTDEDLFFE